MEDLVEDTSTQLTQKGHSNSFRKKAPPFILTQDPNAQDEYPDESTFQAKTKQHPLNYLGAEMSLGN